MTVGFLIIISLFLTWFKYLTFSTTLIGLPGTIKVFTNFLDSWFGVDVDSFPFRIQLAIYIGYAFLILSSLGLYFNNKNDIKKAKVSNYAIPAYFILVIILNMSEMGDAQGGGDGVGKLFDKLGLGFYVFIGSYIANLRYLKAEGIILN